MRFYASIILFVSISSQVFSQDYSLGASFGEVQLVAGFDPDPYTASIYAGGSINLSESTEFSCVGFISEEPDYQISYSTSNENYPLSIFVTSEIDTVLLINDPDGGWSCNDDYSEEYGSMPGIEFASPAEGIYDIWVGVYDQDERFSTAELLITELGGLLNSESAETDISSTSNTPDRPRNSGSGTAFAISELGHLITNYHVIEGCESVTFQLPGQSAVEASVISSNSISDLALLKANLSINPGEFRFNSRLRLGDEIVVYGFPLLENLSSQGNITTGVVSALTGLNDDLSTFQISAQIQPGNSGGPVFDRFGRVVGVVVSMANEEYFSQRSGTTPQNINFAITANITQSFLDTNNVDYVQTNDLEELSIADIAEKAQTFTGSILFFK